MIKKFRYLIPKS
uniref:Uncharacterized protein n=1 Tax=Rhizophora mucronata TaxID=61149 RepID=A0A2P2PWP5_RHIMU